MLAVYYPEDWADKSLHDTHTYIEVSRSRTIRLAFHSHDGIKPPDRNRCADSFTLCSLHVKYDQRWHESQRQPSDGMVWPVPIWARRATPLAQVPDRVQPEYQVAQPG